MVKNSVSKDKGKIKNKSIKRLVKNLLFICNNNLIRSKTAESIMKTHKKYCVKSAGLSHWADVPLTTSAIKWADVIFVMDEEHEMQKSRVLQEFPDAFKKQIVILEIPSTHGIRDDPELTKTLREKLKIYLR